MLYLDTSAMVSLFLEEQRTASVQSIVIKASEEIGLSDLTIGEFCAAISTNVRTERLTKEQGAFALEGADIWIATDTAPFRIEKQDFGIAIRHVRRFELGLLFPDALHLALCARHGLTLVTGDIRQAEAADVLGISLIHL